MMRSGRQRGFTLLEVLIALAVLAIALAAAIKGISSHVENITYLKERTLAHWVGLNALEELRAGGDYPGSGTIKGDETMAGRDFRWTIKVTEISGGDVRRLDVKVVPDDDPERPLSSMIAYLGKPA